jgi:methane monooxygenase PmoA-like
VMDYKVVLTASEGDVHFGETKEGSFGIRVPTSMDVTSKLGGQIVNSEGQTDEAAWGQKATWVDYHGPVDGEPLGIAVLNHPSSFRYPTRWHVRTYGLFAANPWGVKDFTGGKETGGEYTLPKGESLTLRYRVIFHKGDEKQAKIAEAFKQYSAQ